MPSAAQVFPYGDMPVTFQPASSGGLRVLILDLDTRGVFADSRSYSRVTRDRDNLTRALPETEFQQVLQRLGVSLQEEPRTA